MEKIFLDEENALKLCLILYDRGFNRKEFLKNYKVKKDGLLFLFYGVDYYLKDGLINSDKIIQALKRNKNPQKGENN